MRAIWKGYIRFNLVMIPIKVFRATQPKALQFHNLHHSCHSRLRLQRYCPKCNTTVEKEDVVRGYEYGKDKYAIVEDSDLEKVRLPSTHIIDIVQFVDAKDIDPIYFYEAHYIAPEGEAGRQAYALFRQVMGEKGKMALAKVVMANKEHLVAIRPYQRAIVMSTMFYPEEIASVEELENINGTIKVGKEEMKLATSLVEAASKGFRPQEFRDEYTHQLLDIIEAKVAGKEVVAAPKAEVGKIINLMEALRKSVERTKVARKGMARAAGKKTILKAQEVLKKRGKVQT